MMQTIISVLGTILGVILGWTLNCLYDRNAKKVKLCYSLQPATDRDGIIEPELRTKYSDSDYCIQVYNVGITPFLLEKFSLVYDNCIIVDCVIVENNKAIMPYENYTYHLNEQEYDSILHYCNKISIKKCDIIAYDVSGEKCISQLDLFLPNIQKSFCGCE